MPFLYWTKMDLTSFGFAASRKNAIMVRFPTLGNV